jgi:hypothetical protein
MTAPHVHPQDMSARHRVEYSRINIVRISEVSSTSLQWQLHTMPRQTLVILPHLASFLTLKQLADRRQIRPSW